MMKYLLIGFLLMLIPYLAVSQDSLMTIMGEGVEVSATRIPVNIYRVPHAVQKLIVDPISSSRQTYSINEYLSTVPGVFALNQNNSAQDLRVSIRGFGSRSAFGIRGVKILMDGIPLSTPDGQGQVDNIFVGGIRGLEVLNGSSSALYGNASGGVISLSTFSESKENEGLVTIGLGSFRDFRVSLQSHTVLALGDMDHQLFHGRTRGYRDHSASSNFIYNGRLRRNFGDQSKLSLIINAAYSPRGEDPGGINLESVVLDRSAARDRNVSFDAGEEVVQTTIGLSHEYKLSEKTVLESRVFYTRRNFGNRLPFANGGQIDLLRNYTGLSSQASHTYELGGWENDLVLGFEVAYQNDLRSRFVNDSGVRGEETLNQNEVFFNQAIYLSNQTTFKKWLFNIGLRFDNNLISVNDNFEADGVSDGEISLPNISPSFSLSYNLYKYHYISALFSYGFETPTLSELSSRPDNEGGFNADLRAQESYNYEVNYKLFVVDKFSLKASLFVVNSLNELIPYELEEFPGRTFYRNSGKTNRRGLEMSINGKINELFDIDLGYSYSDFKFVETEDISGNTLPGIPLHNGSLAANMHLSNWRLRFQAQSYSSIFTNSSNEVEAPSYTLTNLSLGKESGRFHPYIGVNNLFNNTNYYDNIRINAFGGRYYEAGPPRNFYIGLKFEF